MSLIFIDDAELTIIADSSFNQRDITKPVPHFSHMHASCEVPSIEK